MKYLFGFVLVVACLAHAATAEEPTTAPAKKSSMPNLLAPISYGIDCFGGGISFIADKVTPDFIVAVTDQLGWIGLIVRWALVPVFALLWPIEYVIFWILYFVGLTRVDANQAMLGIRN